MLIDNHAVHGQLHLLSQQHLCRDSTRIKFHTKTASIWTYTSATSTRFNLGSLAVTPDLSITPRLSSNNGLSIGGGFSYGFLTAEYGFLIPSTLQNKNDRARSSILSLGHTGRNFRIEGSITKINGLLYLLPNPNNTFTPIDHFGDISYRNYSASFSYFFNYKRFSYRAANGCSEIQARSAGSIIAAVTPSYQILHSKDSAIINSGYSVTTDSGNLAPVFLSIRKFSAKRIAMISKIGYSYNFVLGNGKWSFNPMLSVIVGADHTVARIPEDAKNDLPAFTFVRGLSWGLNMSYNHPDFYVLFNFHGQTATNGVLMIPNATIDIQSFNFELGYRFKKSTQKVYGIL